MRNAYRNIANDPLSRLNGVQRAYAAANAGQIALRAQLTYATAAHRLGLPVEIRQTADRDKTLVIGSEPTAASVPISQVALATLGCPRRVEAMMSDPRGEGEQLVAESLASRLIDRFAKAGIDASSIEARDLSDEVLSLDPNLRLRGRREMPAMVPAMMAAVCPTEREEAQLLYEAEYDRIVPVVDAAVGGLFPPELRETLVHDSIIEAWLGARTLPDGSTLLIDRKSLAKGSRYSYRRLQGAVARTAYVAHQVFARRTDVDVDGVARKAMLDAWIQSTTETVQP